MRKIMFPELKINLISTFQNWADDNGHITFIQAVIDDGVFVPTEYVVEERITLNISSAATQNLQMADNAVLFKARFDGKVRDIYIPVERINAIFIKDTNIGLGFPISDSPETKEDNKPKLAIVKKPAASTKKAPTAKKPTTKKPIAKVKPKVSKARRPVAKKPTLKKV